jgi:hypothetical protein
MVNLLLIPLLSAGLVHLNLYLSKALLPWSMLLAAAILIVTSLAWMYRPPLGAALQIAAGIVIASIVVIQSHYEPPHTLFRAAFELLVFMPLAGAIVAAVRGRHTAK